MNANGFLALAVGFAAVVPLLWPSGRVPVPDREQQVAGAAGGRRRRQRGTGEDVLSVANAVELMALALGSGVPLVTAVEVVAQRSGPVVGAHLGQVVAALRWGVEDARAWDGLPGCWRPAGQALALAGSAGVPPAGLLRKAAADIRRGEQRRIEEAAERLSVLVVVPLGLCFLPAFALLTVVPVIAALASDLLGGTR